MSSELRAARDAVACMVARRPMPTQTHIQREAALAVISMPPSWRHMLACERDQFALAQMRARRG